MGDPLPEDAAIFERFTLAAHDVCMSGLRFAQADNPAVYRELMDALRGSRARIELVVSFDPLSVALRLFGIAEGDEGDAPQVVEVFRFQVPRHGAAN